MKTSKQFGCLLLSKHWVGCMIYDISYLIKVVFSTFYYRNNETQSSVSFMCKWLYSLVIFESDQFVSGKIFPLVLTWPETSWLSWPPFACPKVATFSAVEPMYFTMEPVVQGPSTGYLAPEEVSGIHEHKK